MPLLPLMANGSNHLGASNGKISFQSGKAGRLGGLQDGRTGKGKIQGKIPCSIFEIRSRRPLVKYTGNMDEDFSVDDCPLLPELLAESVAEDQPNIGGNVQGLSSAILARFRWVYHYNKKWGSDLVQKVNGATGGRDFLAMIFTHWAVGLIEVPYRAKIRF